MKRAKCKSRPALQSILVEKYIKYFTSDVMERLRRCFPVDADITFESYGETKIWKVET